MNTYDVSQIIKMWERMEITVDQAIGQLLLHVQHLSQRLTTLERMFESTGNSARPSESSDK